MNELRPHSLIHAPHPVLSAHLSLKGRGGGGGPDVPKGGIRLGRVAGDVMQGREVGWTLYYTAVRGRRNHAVKAGKNKLGEGKIGRNGSCGTNPTNNNITTTTTIATAANAHPSTPTLAAAPTTKANLQTALTRTSTVPDQHVSSCHAKPIRQPRRVARVSCGESASWSRKHCPGFESRAQSARERGERAGTYGGEWGEAWAVVPKARIRIRRGTTKTHAFRNPKAEREHNHRSSYQHRQVQVPLQYHTTKISTCSVVLAPCATREQKQNGLTQPLRGCTKNATTMGQPHPPRPVSSYPLHRTTGPQLRLRQLQRVRDQRRDGLGRGP